MSGSGVWLTIMPTLPGGRREDVSHTPSAQGRGVCLVKCPNRQAPNPQPSQPLPPFGFGSTSTPSRSTEGWWLTLGWVTRPTEETGPLACLLQDGKPALQLHAQRGPAPAEARPRPGLAPGPRGLANGRPRVCELGPQDGVCEPGRARRSVTPARFGRHCHTSGDSLSGFHPRLPSYPTLAPGPGATQA